MRQHAASRIRVQLAFAPVSPLSVGRRTDTKVYARRFGRGCDQHTIVHFITLLPLQTRAAKRGASPLPGTRSVKSLAVAADR